MSAFYYIGLLCSAYAAIRMLRYLSKLVRQRGLNVEELGDWALVTGATDGIGKAFVKELASRGINIVLVSRTLAKLQTVAAEIEKKYKVKTRVIVVDFNDAETVFEKISEGTKDLNGSIGLLVNNVGMGYDHPEYYLDIENCGDFSRNIVSCNVSSVLNVTRAILPAMVEQRKGAVINLSSFAALTPCPLLSLYAATKAFVVQFSRDLQIEYQSQGITIQALTPHFVVSNMSKISSPSFFVPSAEAYVKSALGKLGVDTVCTGFWTHELLVFALRVRAVLGLVGKDIPAGLSLRRANALQSKVKRN